LLQNNFASFEVTGLVGAGIVFTKVAHAILVYRPRTFWTDTQGLSASKVNCLRFVVLGIAKIKLELEAGIWVIGIIFGNFT
jgi:hypothetical protein